VPLDPGTRLGPYEIVASLGTGGMGEVYRARDTRLDRTVAVKILPSADPDRRHRFEREAKAIAALSHPNICMLHDVGHQDGTDFLVVEYLEGETLADRLARGPLPEDVLVDLGIQIADALETAHASRIIHRDLKPSNVFVTKRGQAKVLDFGLAKIAAPPAGAENADLPTVLAEARLTDAGSALGTVAYMSPEQARGDDVDHRTDVFSFGVVLYEMATGQPAFAGRTTAVIFDEILNKRPAPPSTLNRTLRSDIDGIIARALAKNPGDRYQSAGELGRDLAQARHDLSLDGTSSARIRRSATRIAPRRQVLIALAIVASIALGVAALISRDPRATTVADGPIDSIAVLPFVNASGTEDADYLSEGIAGTLTNNLAQIEGLRVIPRTLAARYKTQTVDPAQAGRDLNARAVVTGRVIQRGDRLTVQAELIDVAKVAQLWGEQFNRPLADVLTVQADISKAIADNLRLRLTTEDEKGLLAHTPTSAVAYQLYLRGQYAAGKRTRDGYHQATQYFNQAIERDPSYALAHAGLADVFIWQAYWGYLPSREAYQKALGAANRAVTLDERLAEGHAALGWISLHHDWDWAKSEREYQRALTLDPTNALIVYAYGESLGTRGRMDEAIAQIRRAAALDPLSGRIATSVGFMLTNARRYDEAIEALKKAIALEPDQTLARLDLARAYRLSGSNDLAIKESEAMLSSGDPLGPSFVAASYAHANRRREALEIVNGMIAKTRETGQGSLLIALVYAALRDKEQAFAWLEQAYQERDTFLAWLKVDPEFDVLHADPRFADLVRRIGIPSR
jgi:eukaryotic-like serine/threonine-protein kinase